MRWASRPPPPRARIRSRKLEVGVFATYSSVDINTFVEVVEKLKRNPELEKNPSFEAAILACPEVFPENVASLMYFHECLTHCYAATGTCYTGTGWILACRKPTGTGPMMTILPLLLHSIAILKIKLPTPKGF
jgi:hypothetical protein